MKHFLIALLLLAGSVCTFGRSAPFDADRGVEQADVIARVRIKRVQPAPPEAGGHYFAVANIGTAIKGCKRGQVIRLSFDTGFICPNWFFNVGGDYIVFATRLPSGHYIPIHPQAIIDVGPGKADAIATGEKIRNRLAAVEAAKLEAIRQFPDLAKPDSRLNAEFLRRYRERLTGWSDFFNTSLWPITLARECASASP